MCAYGAGPTKQKGGKNNHSNIEHCNEVQTKLVSLFVVAHGYGIDFFFSQCHGQGVWLKWDW